MKYLLLIAGTESRLNGEDVPADQAAARMQQWSTYSHELASANKVHSAERLRPSTAATTVRYPDGQRLISDGPYAETKEQLGGFFLIEAKDLDEAVEWASKMPHLSDGGAVEIRPIWEI